MYVCLYCMVCIYIDLCIHPSIHSSIHPSMKGGIIPYKIINVDETPHTRAGPARPSTAPRVCQVVLRTSARHPSPPHVFMKHGPYNTQHTAHSTHDSGQGREGKGQTRGTYELAESVKTAPPTHINHIMLVAVSVWQLKCWHLRM